ncbi:hypothetical protein DPMN_104950 [Dreissena polymorpha]|uniref:Uncharacterized protein n=1 Tax=Dreissena polymorpha TaxID=45954 RepID=A0A9D4K0H6_DREPO|nr:hypothetical protein DPMN_104950 [Dreissena polymorpha]
MTLYVTPDHSTDSTKCESTSSGTYARTHKLTPTPPTPSPVFSRQHSRESNMSIKSNNSQRRKSMLAPPTLSLPPGMPTGKRGSNWSAVADQEILYLSAPRRHSTFIL